MATYKDHNNRPKAIPPDLEMIPGQMKRLPQWVLWQFVWKEETKQWAKIPINADGFQFAKSDDSSTWASFETVSAKYEKEKDRFDGVGFVFSPDDPYCGVDFDNCVNTDGSIDPVVMGQIKNLDSYTEFSASGTGIHVIVSGVYGGGNKRGDKEVYDRTRYFAFTGKPVGELKRINWRQSAIEKLRAQLSPAKTEFRPQPISLGRSATQLLDQAFNSRKGERVKRLYEGDTSDYAGDDSSADLGLCGHLAFWCGGDPILLDQMFRGSKLYREKWDKRHSSDGRTYGEMTIERALQGKTEFYNPTNKQDTVIQPPLVGIYRPRDLRDELFELYRVGRKAGEITGWDGLTELYTVQKQQFTVITGIPGSGKSAVLDALMVNLAQLHGWKFAVCSLETQPIQVHMSMIAELYLGQPFNVGPTPRMSEATLDAGLDWIDDHFTFVLPEEKNRTLEGLIELVSELDVDGVVLDPWNELEHRRPQNMSETEYVSHALSKMRHHARLFNQHWWLVAHPTKLQKDKNTGQYLVPTLYDISGSAHFRNKADFGLVAFRNVEDPNGPTTIFVQKVRFRWCGKIGQCNLYFDKVTGRYSEHFNVYSMPQPHQRREVRV